MPLVELTLPPRPGDLPANVRRFLREADDRIDAFQTDGKAFAFVPSDHAKSYAVLAAVAGSTVARGNRFCEWGCGFGVVAGLASLVGFESYGIEIDGDLIAAARELADDFDLPTEFAHGSFVPPGGEKLLHADGNYTWLTTEADYAYDDLGLAPDDFDVVYAYPWPDEEGVTETLFDTFAGPGAVLVTFHGAGEFRVRRKAMKKKK